MTDSDGEMMVEHPKCVRSGFCCQQATCMMGLNYGAPLGVPCTFLVGDRPGEYACQLILDEPELGDHVAIGGGCSSTLFNNARQEVLQGFQHLRLYAETACRQQGLCEQRFDALDDHATAHLRGRSRPKLG